MQDYQELVLQQQDFSFTIKQSPRITEGSDIANIEHIGYLGILGDNRAKIYRKGEL